MRFPPICPNWKTSRHATFSASCASDKLIPVTPAQSKAVVSPTTNSAELVVMSVNASVLGMALTQYKILYPIVARFAVGVVDYFSWFQIATQLALHYQSMFHDIAAFRRERMIRFWDANISFFRNCPAFIGGVASTAIGASITSVASLFGVGWILLWNTSTAINASHFGIIWARHQPHITAVLESGQDL